VCFSKNNKKDCFGFHKIFNYILVREGSLIYLMFLSIKEKYIYCSVVVAPCSLGMQLKL